MECHYSLLGVAKDASQEDIKKAYKRLALKYHPDKNGGDDTKFKKINLAYQILSDPAKRQNYDTGNNKISEMFQNLYKIFTKMVSEYTAQQQQVLAPTHVKIPVTLEDLYHARIKRASIKIKRKSIMFLESFCISLLNYQCKYVFPKRGDDGRDLVLELDIQQSHIKIDGIICPYDLYVDIDISLYEYYYGVNVEFAFLDRTNITISKCFSDGSMNHVFKGKGLPYYEDGKIKRGDFLVFFRLCNKTPLELPLNDLEFKAFLQKHFS